MEPDPSQYQIPFYCPPMDIGIAPSNLNHNSLPAASIHSQTSPSQSTQNTGLPVSPLPLLYQHSYLFHQDLITWNISLAQMQQYVQSKIIIAAPWPNAEFPKTVLYWSPNNQYGCRELQYNATLILQALKNLKPTGQHFINYTSIVNVLQQQICEQIPPHAIQDYREPAPKPNRDIVTSLLSGLIYARTQRSLEEVTSIGFELVRPPLYFDPTDEQAIELIRKSSTMHEKRNEEQRRKNIEEESFKAGHSKTGTG